MLYGFSCGHLLKNVKEKNDGKRSGSNFTVKSLINMAIMDKNCLKRDRYLSTISDRPPSGIEFPLKNGLTCKYRYAIASLTAKFANFRHTSYFWYFFIQACVSINSPLSSRSQSSGSFALMPARAFSAPSPL